MNKYLTVKFRNSGLYRHSKKQRTKDKVFCVTVRGGIDRQEFPQFVEPIVVNHISNMIHVLFGERPKPMNRYTPYDKIQYYYDKALDSYLKIDTYRDDKDRFPTETVSVNKAVFNCWNPISFMNWNRVHQLLEDDLYYEFVRELSNILGFNILDKSFYDVKAILLSTENDEITTLFNKLNDLNKTALYSSIYGNKTAIGGINQNKRTMLTVNSGPYKINRLDGEVIIPVNDEDIEKLKQNKGCATLLDGGLVYIDSIKDVHTINVDGFRKVSEISLEKTEV